MKYTEGIKELNLPKIYRFGIELEAFNVNTSLGSKSLYHSKESNEFLKQHRWKKANFLEESLVGEGGVELVSPILYDKTEDWQNLQEVCAHMQKYPGKHGKEVVADAKCGCHIHFDSRVLSGKTKEESQAIMGNFLSLWAEAEELVYKMCNDVNDPIRSGALNVQGNPIHRLSLALQGVKGMAMPIGKKIHEAIQNNTLKVSYQKFGRLQRAVAKLKLDSRRYAGLNLTNLGNPDKNTIEFRIANGTLNPEVIKQNVYLYASLIETARALALEPEKLGNKVEEFYRTDVNEATKLENLLNLLFENEQEQDIYRKRWESVKDAEVFIDNEQKGFAPNRFQREEFQQIAKRTPVTMVKVAFAKLKTMIQERTRNNLENGQLGSER